MKRAEFSMEEHCYPFDLSMAQQAGLATHINTTNFPGLRVIDQEAFERDRNFKPCISSIFIFGRGGSCSSGSVYDTHNGSLIHVEGWQRYEKLFQSWLEQRGRVQLAARQERPFWA